MDYMLESKGNQEARHKGLAGAGAQKSKLMATQDLVFKVLIVISTSKGHGPGAALGWCKGCNCTIDFWDIVLHDWQGSDLFFLFSGKKRYLHHQFETLTPPLWTKGSLVLFEM